MSAAIRDLDLFCGHWGLTCSLRQVGIEVVLGVCADPACQHACEANDGTQFVKRDDTGSHQTGTRIEGCGIHSRSSATVHEGSEVSRIRDRRGMVRRTPSTERTRLATNPDSSFPRQMPVTRSRPLFVVMPCPWRLGDLYAISVDFGPESRFKQGKFSFRRNSKRRPKGQESLLAA